MTTKILELLKKVCEHGPAEIVAKVDGDFNCDVKIKGRALDVIPLFSSIVVSLRKSGLREDDIRLALNLGLEHFERGKTK